MTTARLRKVGGSTMLAIPPVILEELQIGADASLDLTVRDGVLRPERKRYTLDELLAACDPDAALSPDERAWIDASAVGGEIIS